MSVLNKGEIIFDIYQIDECIKVTSLYSLYYGFHLRMKKEILIVVGSDLPDEGITELSELSCFPYVIDQKERNGQTITVLNYIYGIPASDYIRQDRQFTDKELVLIGLQVCDILPELDTKGILAESIWDAENVMIASDMQICFLDRSGLSRSEKGENTANRNLDAALDFLRELCPEKESLVREILSGEIHQVKGLKRDLLNILKKSKEYKRMQRRQRVVYTAFAAIFAGSVLLLSRNAALYRESQLVQEGQLAMQNQNYEQAVTDYQNALQLNENNLTARRGIAESYWREGNIEKAEEYFAENMAYFQDGTAEIYLQRIQEEKALAAYADGDYKTALELYSGLEDENPNVKYEEPLLDIYVEQNDLDNVEAVIQHLHSRQLGQALKTRVEEIERLIKESEEARPKLFPLAELIENENWLELGRVFKSQEFTELCETYGSGAYCRYGENKFVKLYGNGSVYLGEMKGTVRSGQGTLVLLGNNYDNVIVFQGEWREDLPNGAGTQKAIILSYLEKNNRQIWMSIDGNYRNGYLDGKMSMQEYEMVGTDKKVFRSLVLHSDMGYLEPLNAADRTPRTESARAAGYYLAGIWDNGETQFIHYGHIEAVEGLGLGECFLMFSKEVI